MLISVADTVRRYASFWNTFLFSFMSIPLYSFCRPQRSWGQGNVFTPVCHSVHWGRGCLPQCMLGYTPLWADTLPWVDTPQADAPSLGRQPPLGRHPLPGRHPPPTSRRLLQRAIRILLECILVFASFCVISFLFVFLIFGILSWFCSNVLFSFSIIFSIWIKFNPLGPLRLPTPQPLFPIPTSVQAEPPLCVSAAFKANLLYHRSILLIQDELKGLQLQWLSNWTALQHWSIQICSPGIRDLQY